MESFSPLPSNKNEKKHSRKRCRPAMRWRLAAVATATVAALSCSAPTTVSAFASTLPLHSAVLLLRPPSHLSMAASAPSASSTKKTGTKKHSPTDHLSMAPSRLTAEEQRELLLQAIESRRIKQLESSLALQPGSHKKTASLLSVRAKEAGYGEDLDAYEDALLAGDVARETLITTNMGLVHYCVKEIIGTQGAKRKRLNSLSREDLIQEGSIGLARAIDRWNPAIGGKFSTYAVYWIRAAILRCIAEKDDMLRVPEHVSTAVRKMTRGAQRLGLELDTFDREISSGNAALWKEAKAAKALAEEAGLTDKQLDQAMRIQARRSGGGYIEFESWMQMGADVESDVSTVASRYEDSDSLRGVAIEDLKKTLGRYLRPKEMEALFWRYGLLNESATETTVATKQQGKDYLARAEKELFGTSSTTKIRSTSSLPVGGKWGEAMSFTEVGKHMEVSAEYGRRLCHAALKKLRQAAEDGHLEPALLY